MARKLFTLPKSFKNDVDRALHDLSQEKATTLHPMTLVPIYFRRMFRGDQFTFGVVESILRSEPTFAPLLSNWRLRFEWYFDSDANRYGWIDNNTRLTSEEVMNRKHHTFQVLQPFSLENESRSEYENAKVGRGGLTDYAGVAPGTVSLVEDELSVTPVNFDGVLNADFYLTYLNIVRNYHVNRQFPNIPYVTGLRTDSGSPLFEYQTYSLSHMDKLFMLLRSLPNGCLLGDYNDADEIPADLQSYYSIPIQSFKEWMSCSDEKQGGLFCSQFEPDLFQNLLAKDQGLLKSNVVAGVQDGVHNSFTIEQFRLKNHLQNLYDKIFVSGGTDRELSRTLWGVESNRDYDIPELISVHTEIIGTNLVTSTTAGSLDTHDSSQGYRNYPGSMNGNVNERRGASRMQKFTAKTSGNLMCIVSLVPLVTYNENIERHLLDHKFMDEFTPDMARKGFEDVPLSDYCSLPLEDNNVQLPTLSTNRSLSTSVGKQVAWLREMTAVNRCHGEFSNGGENYDWLLHRTFKSKLDDDTDVYSISPYGRPTEFQYPFISTDIYSPNFNLQVAIRCSAYRPVPRKFMPNLGY